MSLIYIYKNAHTHTFAHNNVKENKEQTKKK